MRKQLGALSEWKHQSTKVDHIITKPYPVIRIFISILEKQDKIFARLTISVSEKASA